MKKFAKAVAASIAAVTVKANNLGLGGERLVISYDPRLGRSGHT